MDEKKEEEKKEEKIEPVVLEIQDSTMGSSSNLNPTQGEKQHG